MVYAVGLRSTDGFAFRTCQLTQAHLYGDMGEDIIRLERVNRRWCSSETHDVKIQRISGIKHIRKNVPRLIDT